MFSYEIECSDSRLLGFKSIRLFNISDYPLAIVLSPGSHPKEKIYILHCVFLRFDLSLNFIWNEGEVTIRERMGKKSNGRKRTQR